ncbi:MAG TPA: hypothetical protein VFA18_20270, partial [Gemmataceae bacterium]|nr:hypothetical protein [Gemmataceae bacterium]
HLKDKNESVAPAVSKLVQEEQSVKTQLAATISKAKADRALLQTLVQRLTSAKVLAAGASPDKLLASMDQLLRQGSSPVAISFGGVATGLSEVGGAAASGSGHLIQATANLAVNRWRDSLAALTQNHRPHVVTTTVLHQPADEQPALRLPDSLGTYQPESAEKHFSAGFGYYWSGDATQAAREFKAAIQNNHEDARYCYFLGLSLLEQQRSKDALVAFRQGALLEKQGLPDTSAINLILERIQGPTRELLDQYRR